MVELNNAWEVNVILSNRAQLAQIGNIFVKPHLSPTKILVESTLLQKRRLITSGTNSRSIRIKKNILFIGSTCVGTVRDNNFEDMQIITNEFIQPSGEDREPESVACPKGSDVSLTTEPSF